MIKKKPKTISDLKINLEFSKTSNYCPLFTDFEIELRNKNPELINYRIKPGLYSFRIWLPTKEVNSKFHGGGKYSVYEWVVFQINVAKPIEHLLFGKQNDEMCLFNFLYQINYNIYLKIQKDTTYYVKLDEFKREYDDFHYLIELGLPF